MKRLRIDSNPHDFLDDSRSLSKVPPFYSQLKKRRNLLHTKKNILKKQQPPEPPMKIPKNSLVISYTFGLPPTEDASHKWRFRLGFHTKNRIIRVDF